MAEGLPAGLSPPVPLVLAKVVSRIPAAGALPGGCLYEPKWDGFRVGISGGRRRSVIVVQAGTDLARYSVGVSRRRADLWPGESAVISARQVSLTGLSISTSFRTTRTPLPSITATLVMPQSRAFPKVSSLPARETFIRAESRNDLGTKPLTIRGVVRRRLSRLGLVKRKRLHHRRLLRRGRR